MHATSAVVAAAVALNVAGVMAIPMKQARHSSSVLEARTVPAAPAGTGAAGHHAAGAATTTTVTFNPRPTPCKAGEPVTYHGKGKHGAHKSTGSEKSHKHDTGKPKDNAEKPAVVARAETAAATATGTSTHTPGHHSPAPTDAATHSHKGKGHKEGKKEHFATKTGTDGKVTVTHYVKGTSTKCYAPTAAPGAHKGTHNKEATGASHKHAGGAPADGQAPIAAKSDSPKVAARAVTSAPPTGTGAPGHHAAGAATTTTVTFNPRPTPCKAGEPVTYHGKGKHGAHKSTGSEKSHKHDTAKPSKDNAEKPAVVARAETAAATATGTSTHTPGHHSPAPTDAATHSHKGKGHKEGKKEHFATKTGTDGKVTVTHYVKGTSTKCYAPTAAPGAHKGTHNKEATGASHKHAGGAPADGQAPIGTTAQKDKSAVVARAVDLLERYFSELDELD